MVATDADGSGPNGRVTYSIVSTHDKFTIDPQTGWLSTNAVRITKNASEVGHSAILFVPFVSQTSMGLILSSGIEMFFPFSSHDSLGSNKVTTFVTHDVHASHHGAFFYISS